MYSPIALLRRDKPCGRRKEKRFHGPPSLDVVAAVEAYWELGVSLELNQSRPYEVRCLWYASMVSSMSCLTSSLSNLHESR